MSLVGLGKVGLWTGFFDLIFDKTQSCLRVIGYRFMEREAMGFCGVILGLFGVAMS